MDLRKKKTASKRIIFAEKIQLLGFTSEIIREMLIFSITKDCTGKGE